jgi:L-ascorbate metabolism protein UlaG (beta-lactamase superfamily)
MVITHHGGQCFKVSFGDTTLAFDPVSKKSKLPTVKFGSDIAFVSLNDDDFNGTDQVSLGAKEPFVVWGPGEYEFGNVTARGYGVKTIYKGVERYNTIYQVRLEDINMIFLGALSVPEIDPKILGEFGDVDILFVPIGGGDVLDVPAASKLAVKLEAKVIIPMHYTDTALKAFIKEAGAEGAETLDKLTIKKKEVSEREGDIIILKS